MYIALWTMEERQDIDVINSVNRVDRIVTDLLSLPYVDYFLCSELVCIQMVHARGLTTESLP